MFETILFSHTLSSSAEKEEEDGREMMPDVIQTLYEDSCDDPSKRQAVNALRALDPREAI